MSELRFILSDYFNILEENLNAQYLQCKYIPVSQDGICNPELVKRLAEKYNAEYGLYDGCHHFFCNSNWRDIAEGINRFITKYMK